MSRFRPRGSRCRPLTDTAGTAEIANKFCELTWRERNRLMQSITNPSPDFRWARVTGPHLKVLDRYMNVQPWHNNRIKLQVPEGHLDYINASPIELPPSPCPADGRPGAAREPDRYIAMQGPKQASTDHVWRMVAEQLESPAVIVMLTETHEGHMEKCFPYFPRSADDPPLEVNKHDEFGDGFRATVRCEGLEETPAGDAIELRKLVMRIHSRPRQPATDPTASPTPSTPSSSSDSEDTKMTSPTLTRNTPPLPTPHTHTHTTTLPPSSSRSPSPSSSTSPSQSPHPPHTPPPHPSSSPPTSEQYPPTEKTIYHFLYKKWPDFGVPLLSDLDSFFTLMRLSREKNKSPANPRIIHCSAGVGRSGTFVALEHLMRELEAGVLEDYDERVVAREAVVLGGSGEEGEGEGGSLVAGGGMGGGDAVGGGGIVGEGGSAAAAGGGGGAGAGWGASGAGWGDGSRTPGGSEGCDSPVLRLQGQGEDLVFETVDSLREQRRTMVQAESQYLFIYQVLRKLWLDKYGEGAGEGEAEDEGRDGPPAAKRLEVG